MDNPGVKFPPPTLFALGVGLSWLLETRVARIRLVGGEAPPFMMELFGVALAVAGLLLVFWGLLTFWRAKTGIIPMRPATKIVDYGPYRVSRNPMYAGMAIAYFAGAFVLNWGWMLLTLPVILFTLYHLVIKREERYLGEAFPDEYAAYRSRVRRWL